MARQSLISRCVLVVGALALAAVNVMSAQQPACAMTLASPVTGVTSPVRITTKLSDGWRFHFGDVPDGATGVSFDDSGWQTVSIPHTWNRVGEYAITPSSQTDARRGAGWYRLKFNLPDAPNGRRYLLQFEGVATVAQVWVNGTFIGAHQGAFARFRFDITDQLKPGAANVIAVQADNSQPASGNSTENVLPLGGDYFLYGGIYRDVTLVSTDSAQIDMLDHGGPGVYIRTLSVSPGRADVQLLMRLRNFTHRKRQLNLAATIVDADGKPVVSDTVPVTLGRTATAEVHRTLALPDPHLWQGRADPYLYRVTVDLRDGRNVVDRVIQPLGVRTFAFDANNGFILNGKPTPLHGVARHQDRADKGWALSPEDHAEDMATVIEIGANTVRQAHYQHAQEWFDEADEAGMIVWAELPFTHQSSLTHDAPAPKLIENAAEQLTELIRQNYNHPSIVIWAVGNEIDVGALVEARHRLGKGKRAQSLGMLKTLNTLARQEDDSRPTAYADCCDGTAFALPGMEVLTGVTSIMAYNRYFGWYYGAPDDLGKELDRLHAEHPDIPLGVSEYGAGGAYSQHTDNPEGGRVNPVGRPHPEEYQSWYHEKAWPILRARPYLAGTWLWNMFDFSTRRAEGDALDLNDKGLARYDHKARKDAFYFYKANWSNEPVLYTAGRRYVDRAYPVIDIKVYSNAPQVDLTVNGDSRGEAQCPDRVCLWRNVQLRPGPNTVVARATIDGKVLSDEVTWNAPDPAAGLRILAGTLTGVTTSSGLRFGSDNFFVGGNPKSLTPFFVLDPKAKRVVRGTTTPELYDAYREGSFRYELPLPDGKWNITLHMFEPERGKVASRTFDVAADGKVLLHEFNPGAAAGGALTAVTRTFPVRVTHGRLELEFKPRGGDAVVSAITVSP